MATTAQPIHAQSMDDLRVVSVAEFTERLGLKSHWTVRRWISRASFRAGWWAAAGLFQFPSYAKLWKWA